MNDSSTGYTTVPNWMLDADDVTAHMVLVYAALGTYTGRDGSAYPAVPTIAKRAKISPSSVKRALRELEALGLVETLQRARAEGGQTSNLYRLHTTATLGQADTPGRSQGPTPPVSVTYEQEPLNNPSPNGEGVKRARASRIPEPFMVTPAMWEWAAGEGMGKEWVTRETVIFVDYWRGRSGQIAVKADWPATWRNWLRRSHGDGGVRPTGIGPSPARGRAESPDERVQRLMALADQMEAADGEQRALDA